MIKTEKIQKVLARAGYGSRRKIEQLIRQGQVEVNGRVATIGDRVSRKDKIYLNKQFCQRICTPIPTRVLMYHKPIEVVTTRDDPEGRQTVFADLPPITEGRWINVGRLDYNTSGLLLFTSNGELANRLMHPSFELEREYVVRVMGKVTEEMLYNMTHGIKLEDGEARFEQIVDSGMGEGLNHWFHVVVAEGRNRVVRRLWESQEVKVNRLKRVRYGPVILPKSLRPGAWLELDEEQIQKLWDFTKRDVKSHQPDGVK